MVLQKLIQDGHLEVRESLIDMNNTVLKVRLGTKKGNTKNRLISSTGIECRHTACAESKRFDSCCGKISKFPITGLASLFSIACCPCNNIYSVFFMLGKCLSNF